MDRDDDEDAGLIPEEIAIRRGLSYQKIVKRDDGNYVSGAFMPHVFVIDRLHAHGFIDDQQHFYALQFITMHKVFLRDVATIRSITMYEAPDHEPKPAFQYPIEDNDYLRVLRLIRHQRHLDIITEACDDRADSVNYYRLAAEAARTRAAFDALTRAILQLVKQKKNEWEFRNWLKAKRISPDSLTKDQRDQHETAFLIESRETAGADL